MGNQHQKTDPVERFWSKVDVRSADECWEWHGTMSHGYGVFSVGSKLTQSMRLWRAHRYSWFITNGEIPEGMNLCHRCDNRRCVNPNHLFLGSDAVNVNDMVEKGRQARGSKHGRSKLSESDVVRIFELYNSGKLQREIGEAIGVGQMTVSRILRRETWTHIDSQPAELRLGSGFTKLTWRDVNAIRSSASEGVSTKELALRYGISRRNVCAIVAGTTWRKPQQPELIDVE